MATVAEVLRQVDTLKPNQYSEEQKLRWLSECEHMIYNETISRHDGAGEKFIGFGPDADKNTELMAKAPHDSLYRHYIMMQIDLTNQEYTRYNNSSGVFNMLYQDFRAWYTRNHMPASEAGHLKI